jgi:toxin HigB-1
VNSEIPIATISLTHGPAILATIRSKAGSPGLGATSNETERLTSFAAVIVTQRTYFGIGERLAVKGRSDILTTWMQLAFATKSLRQLCENGARAKRDLGLQMAEQLRGRLADLRAAMSVKDLVVGRPREVDGMPKSHIAVDLYEGYHIVSCANHNSIPILESGDVDWSKVTRIKILRIESEHG